MPTSIPNSPKAPEALFETVYRLAAAGDIYAGDNDDKKATEDRDHAKVVATHLQQKYPRSDFSARAATLIYQMEQSIPIYGAERDESVTVVCGNYSGFPLKRRTRTTLLVLDRRQGSA